MSQTTHPAKYTNSLLPIFASMIQPGTTGLDPFGGTGKIFRLHQHISGLTIHCLEIEPDWAAMDSRIEVGNALSTRFSDGFFDWICTSPTYGNRMADHHNAKDGSKRNTYRHCLGKPLQSFNSGQLQWGQEYRSFHQQAWAEAKRVLKPGGLLILNCKNHIRRGQVINVCEWHAQALESMGFQCLDAVKVYCQGNRQGQNGAARVDHEMVYKFVKL